ncbi:hypothetical protein EIP86_000584 [Pleurotus ostreatoroseus]|nr:hypothetical protein EIP86_000584 [Pleurotus ostreatoroseus]
MIKFINLISGSHLIVGSGLSSCTAAVTRSQPFELCGRSVTLLDTPGFDDSSVSDTDILKMIALYLAAMISDFRVGGSSRKNFNMFRKLCGKKTLQNVIILTNMWGEVTPERGAARELELATDDLLFKPLLDDGARMLRNENTIESAQATIMSLFGNRPYALRIQEELVDEHKDIAETEAGQELGRELAGFVKKHRAQLAEVQKELREALRAKDVQAKIELEQTRKELEARISRAEHDRARLSTEYAEEKRKVDDLVQGAMASIRAEDRNRAERQEELRRMTRLAEVSTAERDMWQRESCRLEEERRTEVFTAVGKVLDEVIGYVLSFALHAL